MLGYTAACSGYLLHREDGSITYGIQEVLSHVFILLEGCSSSSICSSVCSIAVVSVVVCAVMSTVVCAVMSAVVSVVVQ